MMDDWFDLPVTYNNREILFPAKLLQLGYTHKFQVLVYDVDVTFEPDEERNYRAIIEGNNLPKNFSASLLEAIAASIKSILQ